MPVAMKQHKSTLQKLKQRGMPWDSLKNFEKREETIRTKNGAVKIVRVGLESNPVAVLLSHSFTSMEH